MSIKEELQEQCAKCLPGTWVMWVKDEKGHVAAYVVLEPNRDPPPPVQMELFPDRGQI